MASPKKIAQSYFSPFDRAEAIDNIPGTGLGLAMSEKCVEVHGGQIFGKSKLGVGTVFIANLTLESF